MKLRLLVYLLFLSFRASLCQNCRTKGEQCSDDKSCCGGCCVESVCIDTYEDCSAIRDKCDEQYCPGGAVCRLYKPFCTGCEVERVCIFLNPNADVKIAGSFDQGSASQKLKSSALTLITVFLLNHYL